MPPGTRCTTREAITDPTSTPTDTDELMSAADGSAGQVGRRVTPGIETHRLG